MAQSLSPQTFGALSDVTFSSGADIDLHFKARTGFDFIDWFNAHLAGKGNFADRRIRPDTGETLDQVKLEFAEFWNAIPIMFGKDRISLFDFAALMCISINEQNGRLRSRTEICGRGAKDATGRRHEGLSYAFDLLPGIKKSYNTLAGNRTAYDCFRDPAFCAAHADLGLADRLSSHLDAALLSESWKGTAYPFQDFSVLEDLAQAGFVMQADFYKFRGRGPIQITGRPAYRKLAEYIQGYMGPNPVLLRFQTQWKALSPDVACTVSRDADWNEIFAQPEIRPRCIRVYADAAAPARNFLALDLDVDKLNGDKLGSLYRVGRTISGTDAYARTIFLPRVVEMLDKASTGKKI